MFFSDFEIASSKSLASKHYVASSHTIIHQDSPNVADVPYVPNVAGVPDVPDVASVPDVFSHADSGAPQRPRATYFES